MIAREPGGYGLKKKAKSKKAKPSAPTPDIQSGTGYKIAKSKPKPRPAPTPDIQTGTGYAKAKTPPPSVLDAKGWAAFEGLPLKKGKQRLTPEQFFPLRQMILGSRKSSAAFNEATKGTRVSLKETPWNEPKLLAIKKIAFGDDAPDKFKDFPETFKVEVIDPVTGKKFKGMYTPGKPVKKGGVDVYVNADFVPEGSGPTVISNFFAPLLKGAVTVAGAPIKGLKLAQEKLGVAPNPTQQNMGIGGAPGTLPRGTREAISKGALASGSVVVEGLSIPGQEVRNQLGRALGLRRSDIRGADILRKLGLPGEYGILVDIGTDPLMYAGLALAPATGGTSLAATVSRLNKVAPGILESAGAKTALKTFAETGDQARYAKDLKKLMKQGTVRQGLLGRRTAVAENQREKSAATIKGAIDDTPSFELSYTNRSLKKGGRKVVVTEKIRMPDQAGLEAVEQAMRAATARQKKAQVRLELMTPMGRKLGLGVPITPNLSKVPYRFASEAAYKTKLAEAHQRARAEASTQRIADLDLIDEQIKVARRKKDTDKVTELEVLRAKTKREYQDIEIAALKAAKDDVGSRVSWKNLVTVGDRVALSNSRKAMHAGKMGADEYGRTIQGILNRAYEKALKPIEGKDRVRSAERVRLYLEATSDTRGLAVPALEQKIGKLTRAEQQVANNLRAVHQMEAEHLVRTGLMPREYVNEGYAGLRLYDHPAQADKMISDEARQFAGTTAQLHQRSAAAFADVSSEAALADKLAELSDVPITLGSARELARQLWDNGALRSQAQLLARQIAREGPVDFADLTELQRHAANYGARHGFDPHSDAPIPLFRTPLSHPDETEGQVMLDAANAGHYGFNPEELATLPKTERSQATLYSLVQDRQQVDQLLGAAKAAGREDVAQDLTAMRERLTEKIKLEDPESALDAQLVEIEQLLNLGNPIAKVTAKHDERLAKIDQEIEELKATHVEAPMPSVELKLHHFKVERNVEGDWAVVPATERGGKAFTPPEEAQSLIEGLNAAYKSKAEAQADLKAHLEQPVDEAAAGVDNTAAIDDLVREREVVEKERAAAQREAEKQIEVQQVGVDLSTIPEGRFTTELDSHGTLWLRGAEDALTDPIEGMAKRSMPRSHYEAGPHDDPYDFVGHLPDFRAPDGAGVMLRLDPRESGYLRSKGHGMAAAYKARFRAVDEVVGRSADEARTRTWNTRDGEHTGDASDLLPHFGDNGAITHFTLRSDSDVSLRAEEVVFEERTLLETGDKTTFVDPRDGTVWYFPRQQLPETMQLKSVAKDRIWPSQAIADFKRELVFGGELTRESPNVVNEFRGLYDVGVHAGVSKYMAIARFGVTTPFPAYHIRNMISDLIKSLQADSGVLFHPIANVQMMRAAYGKGLGTKINFPGYGKMKMEDFLLVADMFGVRTGHHVAEVAQILKKASAGQDITESYLKTKLPLFGTNGWFRPGGNSTKFGAKREDVVRFMTFFQRLRANGGDAADAAFYMTTHHFNYNDLAFAEKRVARNIFLFYTWYRKNIPLQLAEVARRPGFFSALGNLKTDLAAGQTPFNIGPFSGEAPDQPALGPFVHDKLGALTTSWNGYALNVGFGAPWNDLQFLSTEGLKNMQILVSPLVSVPVQLATRQDPLTGRRFKMDETSGYAEIFESLGVSLDTDANGKPVLPWALNVVLRQVPFFGRATYGFTGANETRDQGRLQTYGSLLAGVTGLNIMVSPKPGGGREKYALERVATARVAQRRQLLEDMSTKRHGDADQLEDPTLTDATYLRKIKEFDKATLEEFARRLGDKKKALKYLKNVQQSGFYESPSTGPPSESGELSLEMDEISLDSGGL